MLESKDSIVVKKFSTGFSTTLITYVSVKVGSDTDVTVTVCEPRVSKTVPTAMLVVYSLLPNSTVSPSTPLRNSVSLTTNPCVLNVSPWKNVVLVFAVSTLISYVLVASSI